MSLMGHDTRPGASAGGLRLLAGLLAAGLLATACAAGTGSDREVTAVFTGTNNLFVGSEVRVLGLRVGEVAAITPVGDHVSVELRVDADRPLPAGVGAHLTPVSLIGERFVQLDPPYTGGPELPADATIGLERTSVPADVDEVLASLEHFLEGLDPHALAELVDTLATTIAGQGDGLNRLIEGGAQTVRVLSDASEDLTAIVAELADLNAMLATRDERIGPLLADFRTVLRTLNGEKAEIIEGLANLQRLTLELRPLLEDHTDPLVTDLEVLATTLSTVERNLERVGDLALQARRLFAGMGGAIEYPQARIPLQNQTGELTTMIEQRLAERFAGVCVRLDFAGCAQPEFFAPHIAAASCDGEEPACAQGRSRFGDALRAAVGALPSPVAEELDAQARAPAGVASEGRPGAPAAGDDPAVEHERERPRLPNPDPRLEDDGDGGPGLLERLLGGGP